MLKIQGRSNILFSVEMGSDQVEITKKLIEGDEKAFRDIYDCYHKYLYFVAYKFLKNESLAQDAVQDIFLKLWTNRKKLRPGHSCKAFLRTCLKNHLINLYRSRNREALEKIEVSYKTIPRSSQTTFEEVVYADYERILQGGIGKLSARKREIFKLSAFKGLSRDEIADRLGISSATAKLQIVKSTQFVKAYLREHFHTFMLLTCLLFS